MIARKEIVVIAATLKQAQSSMGLTDDQHLALVANMSEALLTLNPRFDAVRFLKACRNN